MKGIIILCEGRHDAAFLSVLLECEGYRNYKKTIKEMITPLYEYFTTKFSKYEYESNELFERPILPYIMKKQEGQGEMFILIYSMDGMNKITNYKEILTDFYFQANENEDFASNLGFQNSIFSLAFILDADDKGIANRVDYIKANYTEIVPEIENIGHGKDEISATGKKRFKAIGSFILTGNDNEHGNLEDIILPIMEKNNESVFNEAGTYLSNNNFIRHKRGSQIKDENKTKSDFKKSKIGVVGQLQCSGCNNTDIIRKSNYLNGRICADDKAKEIIEFIKKMRSETNKR